MLPKAMIDFKHFTHVTFDCYGTLIDWERGILAALTPVLKRHGVDVEPEHILRLYARFEVGQEAGPYQPYYNVLRKVTAEIASELGFVPTEADLNALPESLGSWPPFPDTIEASEKLKRRYCLVVISNVDDALFAQMAKRLGVSFSDVITAEQVGSYKPCHRNFELALQRMGVPAGQVLHVAQSLYHDHVPAKALGFTTAWVNRASRLTGTGLAPPAEAVPDLEVPDLQSLVELMGL